jgi:type II secretory pathway pseudopilin PulG
MSAASSRRGGFTLLETLLALSISVLVGGSIISLMIYQTQLTATQNRNILNQETVRETMHFMTEEILSMGSSVIEPYLDTAAADELTYVGDLDNDGNPDKVRYLYDANAQQLSRTLYSSTDQGQTWDEVSTDVLLDNLSQFSFTFYGANDIEPTGVDDVTSIKIELAQDTAGTTTALTNGRVASQSMMTRVTIRNRRLH